MIKLTTFATAPALGLTTSLAYAGDAATGVNHDKYKTKDCTSITDGARKAKCEARQAAMEKCKDTKGDDRKKCMMDAMPKKEGKK
jgi:hypothetical protein